MTVKVIGSNPGNLLKSFLLYTYSWIQQILGNLSKMEDYTQGTSVQRWIFFYFISSSLSSNVRAQSYILNLGSPNHRVLPCNVEKTNFFLTKNSRPELIVIALMSTLYLDLFDPNYNDGKCFIRKCTKYEKPNFALTDI